jgi:hypothetical protein
MKKVFLGALALSLFVASCNNDDDTTTVPTTANLSLDLNGLEDLGTGFAYEGWVVVDGTPVTTGTFTVNTDGVLSQTIFEVPITTLDAATKFVLSIEPSPDLDPAPSDQKLIAGDFSGDTATVGTDIAPALGDLSGAAGTFFLRTPTDEADGAPNNMNDENGVWFGLPGMPPAPNLTLPTLPTGWTYEGWVIGASGPLSTGTFTAFNVVDDNAGAATSFSGTEKIGPQLPGEDFFNNAPMGETFPLDIRGRTVVISVEPVPDNSPAPFLLKPLVGMAGQDTAPATYDFVLNAASFPTGSVSRQ